MYKHLSLITQVLDLWIFTIWRTFFRNTSSEVLLKTHCWAVRIFLFYGVVYLISDPLLLAQLDEFFKIANAICSLPRSCKHTENAFTCASMPLLTIILSIFFLCCVWLPLIRCFFSWWGQNKESCFPLPLSKRHSERISWTGIFGF